MFKWKFEQIALRIKQLGKTINLDQVYAIIIKRITMIEGKNHKKFLES